MGCRYLSFIKSSTFWIAFGALATACAVVLAVWHQDIKQMLNKPKLEFSFFEPTNLHLNQHIGVLLEKDKKEGGVKLKEFSGLFITVNITNTGMRVARNAQAFLSKIYYKKDNGNWEYRKDWMIIPLRWVVHPLYLKLDLIPEIPYLFDLGSFGPERDGKFLFNYSISPKGQAETVGPGEYCFEVKSSAEGADVETKYFYVTFIDFSGVTDFEKIKDCIKKVEMEDHPPL